MVGLVVRQWCYVTTNNITILCFHWWRGARRLGAAFLFVSHSGGMHNHLPKGLQTSFSYNIGLINPDGAFPTTEKECRSREVALAMKQSGCFHNNRINIFCFHRRVEGLVLHVCVSPIQVADKHSFPNGSQNHFTTPLT